MRFLFVILTAFSSFASGADWKSADVNYVLYTNDVEAYRNQSFHFEVKVCNDSTKSCETLAKSKTFKYVSSDKAFSETLRTSFTKKQLNTALTKLNVTADNAQFSFGAVSKAESLKTKMSELSGQLNTYFQTESSRTAEVYYYHPKSGIVETTYVQIFTR